MKKIFLTFFGILFFANIASAQNYENLCAQAPYPVSGSAAQFFSNITGANFILTKIAESNLQRALKKEFGSNFNVEVYAYGAKNYREGKFKRVTIASNNPSYEGFYITDFEASSICTYNYVSDKYGDMYFGENFLAQYSAKITDTDLKKTILSKEYMELISKLDFSIGNLTLFKVHDPSIEIKNNRICFSIKGTHATLLAHQTQTLNFDFTLKVEDEKIVLSDININSNTYGINKNTVLNLINRINPFAVKVKIDDRNAAIVKVKDLKIENNTIYFDGIVIVPKTSS